MTGPEIALIHRMVVFVIKRAPIEADTKSKLLNDMKEIFIQYEEDIDAMSK